MKAFQGNRDGLQRKLGEFLSESFVRCDDGVHHELRKALETSFRQLQLEEKALSFPFKKLSDLNIEEFVHVDEDETCRRGLMLSKKLKIIKFYYLHIFVFSSGHYQDFSTNVPRLTKTKDITDFLKSFGTIRSEDCSNGGVGESGEESESVFFKRGEEEYYLQQLGYKESDFEVKTFEEWERKIAEFVRDRRDEAEKARTDGKRTSFMERITRYKDDNEPDSEEAVWRSGLDEMRRMVIQVGILLSLCLSGFLFVASESEGVVKQYRKHFKGLLKSLVDDDSDEGKYSGVAMKRVISVLDSAEEELVKLGKMSQEALDDGDDDHDQSQDVEIDQVLDMLLREVLCLESVMSFPTLPSDHHDRDNNALMNLQVSNLLDALRQGKKEMEKIAEKVHYMRTVQCGPIEDSTDVEMARFRQVMDVKIIQTWRQLGKSEDDSG